MVVSANASLVFDSLTQSTSFLTTSGTPRHMMAMAFSLGNVSSGPGTINGLDFEYASITAQAYNNIQFDISFWDTASNATTGATAAFTNRVASYSFTTGAVTRAANTVYTIQSATPGVTPGVTLPTTFNFSGISNLGVQILVRGDIGNGLVNSDNLTFGVVSATTGPAVGSFTAGTAGTNGFYRNASQTTPTNADTSLLGSDFRQFTGGTNNGLGIRLYSQPVPEPASMAILGIGALAVLRRRRSSKK